MMRIQVHIYADCYKDLRGYQGAVMGLLADPYVVKDALQRARVPEGGESTGDWPDFLWTALFNASPLSGENALGELNLLADAVSRMDEIQSGTFEGALQLHPEETGKKTATLKKLINPSACLDDYEFHPGVTNDLHLGRTCMEGGMLELVESLPVCGDNRQGLISLLIKSPGTADKGSSVWLELPADEKALRWALISLDEESFDPCWIEEVRSPVMMLQDQLVGCMEMK